MWRYARHRRPATPPQAAGLDFGPLWDVLSGGTRAGDARAGMRPQSVVDDADEAELLRRQPDARVEHVEAGHSVQGDTPVELAGLIGEFVDPAAGAIR